MVHIRFFYLYLVRVWRARASKGIVRRSTFTSQKWNDYYFFSRNQMKHKNIKYNSMSSPMKNEKVKNRFFVRIRMQPAIRTQKRKHLFGWCFHATRSQKCLRNRVKSNQICEIWEQFLFDVHGIDFQFTVNNWIAWIACVCWKLCVKFENSMICRCEIPKYRWRHSTSIIAYLALNAMHCVLKEIWILAGCECFVKLHCNLNEGISAHLKLICESRIKQQMP